MSRVFLVRHAQASFLQPNYDQLSPLGERQARLLGEFWARQGLEFDRVVTGPRVRQTGTASIAGQACQRTGVKFPEPCVMEEFDEYQGESVLDRSLPELLQSDGQIRALHQAYQGSGTAVERQVNFQRIFEAVIGKWVDGGITLPDVESWSGFCSRVHQGLTHIISTSERGHRVAIFCSAGPISVAVQRALNLSQQDTLRVAWMVRNCSYSEFLYSGERFSLSTFNSYPHLDEDSLLTYR